MVSTIGLCMDLTSDMTIDLAIDITESSSLTVCLMTYIVTFVVTTDVVFTIDPNIHITKCPVILGMHHVCQRVGRARPNRLRARATRSSRRPCSRAGGGARSASH
eukprot:7036876-Pyramimonas_sp.AAC.1